MCVYTVCSRVIRPNSNKTHYNINNDESCVGILNSENVRMFTMLKLLLLPRKSFKIKNVNFLGGGGGGGGMIWNLPSVVHLKHLT